MPPCCLSRPPLVTSRGQCSSLGPLFGDRSRRREDCLAPRARKRRRGAVTGVSILDHTNQASECTFFFWWDGRGAHTWPRRGCELRAHVRGEHECSGRRVLGTRHLTISDCDAAVFWRSAIQGFSRRSSSSQFGSTQPRRLFAGVNMPRPCSPTRKGLTSGPDAQRQAPRLFACEGPART